MGQTAIGGTFGRESDLESDVLPLSTMRPKMPITWLTCSIILGLCILLTLLVMLILNIVLVSNVQSIKEESQNPIPTPSISTATICSTTQGNLLYLHQNNHHQYYHHQQKYLYQ